MAAQGGDDVSRGILLTLSQSLKAPKGYVHARG